MAGCEDNLVPCFPRDSHALGLPAHANVSYETTGQRPGRLTDEIKGLRARIENLEGPR